MAQAKGSLDRVFRDARPSFLTRKFQRRSGSGICKWNQIEAVLLSSSSIAAEEEAHKCCTDAPIGPRSPRVPARSSRCFFRSRDESVEVKAPNPEMRFVGRYRSDVSMIRLALALAVILPLASSGANAQSSEGQQPETPPPGAQAPGAQPPAAQPPGAQAPAVQPPGAQAPAAQPPAAQAPGAQAPEAQPPGAQAPGAQAPGAQPPGAQPPAAQPNGPPQARPRGARFREACQPDLARFCSQLRPGGGRLWRCVKQHFPKLSPSCQQLIMRRGQ